MIAKRYRLGEREVARCLRDRPLIHRGLWMARITRNRCGFCRLWLVLSGKVARTSVDRNFFRRALYDLSLPFLNRGAIDILITPKKGIGELKRRDSEGVASFHRELTHLITDALRQWASLPPPRGGPPLPRPKHTTPSSIPVLDARTLVLARLNSSR